MQATISLNCSAKRVPRPPGGARERLASMEGRAIARPNMIVELHRHPRRSPTPSLQWRAEQLLGQTRIRRSPTVDGRAVRRFNGGPSNCSAKPGGDGAVADHSFNGGSRRPNLLLRSRRCFNGGPSNCSAKPDPPPQWLWRRPPPLLQWRAEQLLGQTPSAWRSGTCQ